MTYPFAMLQKLPQCVYFEGMFFNSTMCLIFIKTYSGPYFTCIFFGTSLDIEVSIFDNNFIHALGTGALPLTSGIWRPLVMSSLASQWILGSCFNSKLCQMGEISLICPQWSQIYGHFWVKVMINFREVPYFQTNQYTFRVLNADGANIIIAMSMSRYPWWSHGASGTAIKRFHLKDWWRTGEGRTLCLLHRICNKGVAVNICQQFDKPTKAEGAWS